MITKPTRNFNSHAQTSIGPNDHHNAPTYGSIINTTQVMTALSEFLHETILPNSNFVAGNLMLKPKARNYGALLFVGIDRTKAHGQSWQLISTGAGGYWACFNKNNGAASLTQPMYNLAGLYIQILDAWIEGNRLKVNFKNADSSTRTLSVVGTYALW